MNKRVSPPRTLYLRCLNWRSCANWLLYLLAVLAVAIPISLMYLRFRGDFSWSQSLGNALLVIMPFVLLTPRFRWTVLIPVWLTAIFYESNLLYWRFFRDFIPLRDYFLFQNFDAITFNAGLSMVKVVDLALILPAVAVSLIYFVWLRKPAAAPSSRFSVKSKIIVVTTSIICFVGSELCHVCYHYYCSKMLFMEAIIDR